VRPWRLLIVGAIAIAGLITVGPQLWHYLMMRSSPGQILAVFVDPAADGHARLALAYDFEVHDQHGAYVQQANGIGGHGGRRSAIDLPADEAANLADRIRRTPVGMVFYSANDPEGSAFIMPKADRGMRHYSGLGLMLLALMLCLPPPGQWRRPGRIA